MYPSLGIASTGFVMTTMKRSKSTEDLAVVTEAPASAADVSPKPRRAPGRPRSFDRDTALESAMHVFWERGYETASISDLTAAMGINAPSLYGAFGDKEQLFLAAIERYIEKYGEMRARALREEPTARAGIERWLTEAARELTRTNHPRGCMVEMAATNCSAGAERVWRSLRQRRAKLLDAVARRIQESIDAGDLKPTANVNGLAHFYSLVYHGMSVQARDGASREVLLDIVRMAMRAWPDA